MKNNKPLDMNWKNLTFTQTFNALEKLFKENNLVVDEVVDDSFSNEVEFLLGSKGRWLLCHIGKEYPYYIRFRLIGERTYEKVKPEKFVSIAKDKLLH